MGGQVRLVSDEGFNHLGEIKGLEREDTENFREAHALGRVRGKDALEAACEQRGVEGFIGEELREVALAQPLLLGHQEREQHLEVKPL